MSYELIALSMFGAMMVMLLTGQRVFAAIGFVASGAALLLYGTGAMEMPYSQVFKLFNWFPMLTLPLFIYMGYVLSEAGIAEDLYRMLHVWFGRLRGGLAIGTILLALGVSSVPGSASTGAERQGAQLLQRVQAGEQKCEGLSRDQSAEMPRRLC